MTKASLGDQSYETVYRGCAAAVNTDGDFMTDIGTQCSHFQGCQEAAGTRVCLYCCDYAGCNNRTFDEVDAGITKCWQCQAELNPPDGPPADVSACESGDFNGTSSDDGSFIGGDVPTFFALPCASGTCMVSYSKRGTGAARIVQ